MTDKEIAECYQPLFDYMYEEHGIILIESELDEIIAKAEQVKQLFFEKIKG